MKFFRSKNKSNADDRSLIEEYRLYNNRDAASALFDRYVHLVFGTCMELLRDEEQSKDATMSIFSQLLDDLKKYDIKNFNGWIYQVSRNLCLKRLKTTSKQISFVENNLNGESNDAENNFETEEEYHPDYFEKLPSAIEALDPRQKICIEEFYLKEKSYSQIAALTGYSMLQVKSYIQNGKRNLKNYLLRKNETAHR